MNPYDTAYSLAKALKNSQEYTSYCQVRDKLKGNEQALKMFKDMRQKEMELGRKQMIGQELTEKEREQFQSLRDLAMIHSVIKEYLQQEERLHVLMMDIQRIIGDALDIGIEEDDEEDEKDEGVSV